MPNQVTEIELLREYVSGVVGSADYHAQNVNEIIYALVGAIVCNKHLDL